MTASEGDAQLVKRQLHELALLDDAHRAHTRFLWIAGALFAIIGLSCPATGVVGNVLEPYVHSPIVHRMANVPIWVMAIMVISCAVLGGVGFVFGWRLRNTGSPVLNHLRSHPSDPLVGVQTWVEVRRGARSASFQFMTRAGHELYQVTDAKFETLVLGKLDTALPKRG